MVAIMRAAADAHTKVGFLGLGPELGSPRVELGSRPDPGRPDDPSGKVAAPRISRPKSGQIMAALGSICTIRKAMRWALPRPSHGFSNFANRPQRGLDMGPF